jgi:hypothetical protein
VPDQPQSLPRLTSQEAADLMLKFPAAPLDKQRLLEYGLQDVSDEALAAVANALDKTIPGYTWNSAHTLQPALVLEHAVEEGRFGLAQSLLLELQRRKDATKK